jgi:hypothetical protein
VRDGKRFVVWGDEEGKAYDEVWNLSLADNKPLYYARRDEKRFVVWGDEEGKAYNVAWDLSLADNKLLYCAEREGKEFIVWGDEEGKAYDCVSCPSLDDGMNCTLYTRHTFSIHHIIWELWESMSIKRQKNKYFWILKTA